MFLTEAEGFSGALKGSAEKDLDCKEALEGFSRRCQSFICEEVCCFPLRALSLMQFSKSIHFEQRKNVDCV